MNLSNSNFAIPNPLSVFDRWLNRHCHQRFVRLNYKTLEVNWTKRAEAALNSRKLPLYVEMQLYFSCVVKKRVVFHDQPGFGSVAAVNDKLQVCYRAIQSAACDPETLAREYPEQRLLDSKAAENMQPSTLSIDFRNGQWLGETGFAKPRTDHRDCVKVS